MPGADIDFGVFTCVRFLNDFGRSWRVTSNQTEQHYGLDVSRLAVAGDFVPTNMVSVARPTESPFETRRCGCSRYSEFPRRNLSAFCPTTTTLHGRRGTV